MEFRVLRYFLAVAREENITGAANVLHVTQPTLSRQIHDLEDELGCELFVRKSHRVELTAEGALLKKRAEEIIAMVQKTKAEFTPRSETVGGDVYIGGGETQGIRSIAEVITGLRREFDGIRFHLHSGNAEDVLDRLDKGLLDFGVVIDPANIEKYDSLVLPDKDRWGVIMRSGSPLAQKSSIRKDDLRGLPLIMSRQSVSPAQGGNAFARWFGSDFERLNIAATYNLVYNAAILAETGAGYALTLDRLVDTTGTRALAFRPLEPALEAGLSLVWKKQQVFSPAAELFLKRLREFLKQRKAAEAPL